MKRTALLLSSLMILFLTIHFSGLAQTRPAVHTFYGEGLGSGANASLHYDLAIFTPLKLVHLSLGIGYQPFTTLEQMERLYPLHGSLLFGNNKIYGEAGIVVQPGKLELLSYMQPFAGIRYQPAEGGLFLRAYLLAVNPSSWGQETYFNHLPIQADVLRYPKEFFLLPGFNIGYTLPSKSHFTSHNSSKWLFTLGGNLNMTRVKNTISSDPSVNFQWSGAGDASSGFTMGIYRQIIPGPDKLSIIYGLGLKSAKKEYYFNRIGYDMPEPPYDTAEWRESHRSTDHAIALGPTLLIRKNLSSTFFIQFGGETAIPVGGNRKHQFSKYISKPNVETGVTEEINFVHESGGGYGLQLNFSTVIGAGVLMQLLEQDISLNLNYYRGETLLATSPIIKHDQLELSLTYYLD